MQPNHFPRPIYTGAFPEFPPFMGNRGTCPRCGQPHDNCCCTWRECRKEAKEILVEAAQQGDQATKSPPLMTALAPQLFKDASLRTIITSGNVGTATAFVGGGCCVHLSVEYAAQSPTQACVVIVLAQDADGTSMIWGRSEQAGAGYRIKQNIITVKPGATITIDVLNATARLRWCEVFSC